MYIGILPSKLHKDLVSELKRSILFFDKIGIPAVNNQKSYLSQDDVSEELKSILPEIDFLQEQNLLFDSWPAGQTINLDDGDFHKMQDELNAVAKVSEESNDSDIYAEGMARVSATTMNMMTKDNETTISVPILNKFKFPNELKLNNSDVVKIIINNIPIANENTPWEDILNFKKDPDNIGRLATLRNWNHKVLKSNYSVLELKDEVESLMYYYEKSLQIHKIKYYKTIGETVFAGGLEVIENVAKFKGSEISKKYFEVRRIQAELLSIELNAPGKELAFIQRAKEVFK